MTRTEKCPAKKRTKTIPHRRRKKSRSYEDLLIRVRNRVLAKSLAEKDTWFGITVEGIAKDLGARHGEVQKAFYQLVREGILGRPFNEAPHDTNRNRMFPMNRSGWSPSVWPYRK